MRKRYHLLKQRKSWIAADAVIIVDDDDDYDDEHADHDDRVEG